LLIADCLVDRSRRRLTAAGAADWGRVMRKLLTIIAGAIIAGVAALAEPAAARIAAGATADARTSLMTDFVTDLPGVVLAQHRPARSRPSAPPPRAATSPRTSIESTYRDPTTRGSLLNCSFC
jgi:hypothetical protein